MSRALAVLSAATTSETLISGGLNKKLVFVRTPALDAILSSPREVDVKDDTPVVRGLAQKWHAD